MSTLASPQLWLISGLWGLCAAGASAYCAQVARQMTYVTLSDGRRQERRLPFLFRFLLPFTPGIELRLRGPATKRLRDSVQRLLVSAGFDGLLQPSEFLALRLLFPLVFGALAVGILVLALTSTGVQFLMSWRVPFSVIAILLCALYPGFWLKGTVNVRHRSIRRSLPFLLDILTLSVEAGLDFMTALQRHVERSEVDALGEELLRVIREIQLGRTRREALRDLSWRVNFQDLRTVVNALVQADELGVSIGTILRVQADQIRQRRFERAERLANQAPLKLLFPLVVFIFPAVFLILLGPVLLRISLQGF